MDSGYSSYLIFAVLDPTVISAGQSKAQTVSYTHLVDHWGLELLTVEVYCLLVALDSLVAHRTVWCVLTLQTDF